jgi:diketogulonate reductase-like aldo/keto reductase
VKGLNQTLLDLGLEYLDLYLMHWPVGNDPETGKLDYDYVTVCQNLDFNVAEVAQSFSHTDDLQTWQAMVKLLSTRRVRNIGVANFSPHQIHELIRKSHVKPVVHQMELHPYLQQAEWVDFHQKHGIHVTAYSPLGNMNPIYRKSSKRDKSADPPLLLENKVMEKIAEERGCTPAQVALAWGISRGTSVIPKSSHPEYIRENYGSLECRLA